MRTKLENDPTLVHFLKKYVSDMVNIIAWERIIRPIAVNPIERCFLLGCASTSLHISHPHTLVHVHETLRVSELAFRHPNLSKRLGHDPSFCCFCLNFRFCFFFFFLFFNWVLDQDFRISFNDKKFPLLPSQASFSKNMVISEVMNWVNLRIVLWITGDPSAWKRCTVC